MHFNECSFKNIPEHLEFQILIYLWKCKIAWIDQGGKNFGEIQKVLSKQIY